VERQSWLDEYDRLVANGLSPHATRVAVWPKDCREPARRLQEQGVRFWVEMVPADTKAGWDWRMQATLPKEMVLTRRSSGRQHAFAQIIAAVRAEFGQAPP